MGQAKLRGSRSNRVAEALKKIEALKPEHIVCNECQSTLTEIDVFDSRGMPGIKAAFGALCPTCDSVTWAILGDPNAVAHLYDVMESEVGTQLKTGYAATKIK